jgi:hypothetical protein
MSAPLYTWTEWKRPGLGYGGGHGQAGASMERCPAPVAEICRGAPARGGATGPRPWLVVRWGDDGAGLPKYDAQTERQDLGRK